MVQTRMDGMFDSRTSNAQKVFDRLELLKTVAIHIATSDQVSIAPISRQQN